MLPVTKAFGVFEHLQAQGKKKKDGCEWVKSIHIDFVVSRTQNFQLHLDNGLGSEAIHSSFKCYLLRLLLL